MIFEEFQNRKQREFHPLHELPGPPHFDYILLPYGYILNREYEEARVGDTLVFHDGARRSVRMVCKIPMNACCDARCRMRYGVPLKRVLMQWQNNAVLLGSGKRAVSEEECLIVFYGEEDTAD